MVGDAGGDCRNFGHFRVSVAQIGGSWTATKAGKRVAFVEGRAKDDHGRLVATASGSFLVFPIKFEKRNRSMNGPSTCY
jgi:hypothetical protein